MSDALLRLGARAIGRPDTLRPVLRGLFMDDGAGAPDEDAGWDGAPFPAAEPAPRRDTADDALTETVSVAAPRPAGETAPPPAPSPPAAPDARTLAAPEPPPAADAPLLPARPAAGAPPAATPPQERAAVAAPVVSRGEAAPESAPQAPAAPVVRPTASASASAPVPPATDRPDAALLVPGWEAAEEPRAGEFRPEMAPGEREGAAPHDATSTNAITGRSERPPARPEGPPARSQRSEDTRPAPSRTDSSPPRPSRADRRSPEPARTETPQDARGVETAPEAEVLVDISASTVRRTPGAGRRTPSSPLETSLVSSTDERAAAREADPQPASETLLLPRTRVIRQADAEESPDRGDAPGRQGDGAAQVERFAPAALRPTQGRDGAGERPVVHVTIGRVEVRAAQPPPPPPAPARAAAGWTPPVVSLDAYLKRGAR
jgi:hypothetical protein